MFNTTIAALIDAAIPLRTTAISVAACQLDSLVMDPTKEEEDKALSNIWHIYDVQKEPFNLIACEWLGPHRPSPETTPMFTNAAKQIFASLRGTVKTRLETLKL